MDEQKKIQADIFAQKLDDILKDETFPVDTTFWMESPHMHGAIVPFKKSWCTDGNVRIFINKDF